MKCPNCGYKNYITKEDIDTRRMELLLKRAKNSSKLKGLCSYLKKIKKVWIAIN